LLEDGKNMLRKYRSILLFSLLAAGVASADFTRNIMITGYWPQSNNMIREFSTNPDQNPDGWIGENWEGRGYNIHSFFPEFPDGLGQGVGDFEVDYQDTSADFWRITEELHPVAIITFGRGNDDRSWEIESRYRNLDTWVNDYQEPRQPTPNPPDESLPAGAYRYSTLPMDNIAAAVNAAYSDITIDATVDTTGNAGGFLCEYIGYHAAWYHDLHSDPSDPAWNIAAGHIHIGGQLWRRAARIATQITLRELTTYLDTQIPEPGTLALPAAVGLIAMRRRAISCKL
jgi:hypothetical protein